MLPITKSSEVLNICDGSTLTYGLYEDSTLSFTLAVLFVDPRIVLLYFGFKVIGIFYLKKQYHEPIQE